MVTEVGYSLCPEHSSKLPLSTNSSQVHNSLLILWVEVNVKWASQVALPRSKEPACQNGRYKRSGFDPWVRKISWKRARQPTPVFLPGESHGQRSLAGYSPWGPKESDTTERLTLVTTMSGNTQICLATWPCHKYFPINILPSSQNCSPYSPPMVYVFKAKWFKNKK